MIRVTWHGHATVSIGSGGHNILIDPFVTDNPVATAEADGLEVDFMVVSHGHGDHVGDVERIGKRTGAQLVSSPEICGWFAERGVGNSKQMNIGGWSSFPFGRLKFTPAWHSSSLPDGSYGGMPMGILLETGGKTIYHAGDTALFSDMSLIGDAGIDLAFLPIGSNFTMGPAEALEAARLLRPKTVVPVHYNTFPAIEQDPHAFARELEQDSGVSCLIPEPGESFEL